jgi:hypothetical protein
MVSSTSRIVFSAERSHETHTRKESPDHAPTFAGWGFGLSSSDDFVMTKKYKKHNNSRVARPARKNPENPKKPQNLWIPQTPKNPEILISSNGSSKRHRVTGCDAVLGG